MTTARYGMGRQGAVVHIIHEVRPPDAENRVLTVWKCKRVGGSYNAVHLHEIGRRVACKTCQIAADDTDERRLYVARVGDMIKVGTSNQVGLRLACLKGQLIASAPGGFDKERVLLDSLEVAPVKGREWFAAEAEEEILTALMAVA